jgi:hypothetical protein
MIRVNEPAKCDGLHQALPGKENGWTFMRKVLATLTIISLLSLMAGEASAAKFNIRQTSNLFKRMGCGYNPEGCSWCTQGGSKCYLVDKCTDGWCSVWTAPKNDSNPNPGIGPVGLKNPPTIVSDPTNPPRRPVAPVKPVNPVAVSNPNTGNNAPVILRRENDSGGQGHKH